MANSFIVVGLGGAIGSALQHAVNIGSAYLLGVGFPYGTFFVNVVGSLAMGVVAGYFAFRGEALEPLRLFLATGILGGFTTFSAFSLDAGLLYERGQLWLALTYTIGLVVLSIAALFIGLSIIRQLT